MEQKSDPLFRGNIPPTGTPPPRDIWVEAGHPAPIELKQVPQRFVTQALAHIERDHSTLSFDEAIRWQTRLQEVCWNMLYYVEDSIPGDVIFFDPETRSFWLYRD